MTERRFVSEPVNTADYEWSYVDEPSIDYSLLPPPPKRQSQPRVEAPLTHTGVAVSSERHPRYTPERGRKLRRGLAGLAIGTAALTGIGGVVYGFNLFGTQNIAHDIQQSIAGGAPDNGIQMAGLLTGNPDSLSVTECKDPASVYAIATVSGTFPIIPTKMLNAKTTTPYVEPKYMTLDTAKNEEMTKSQTTQWKKYVTESGYPEVTVDNMPIALTICNIDDGLTIDGKGNYTIDRSKLQIKFEDPTTATMYNMAINPQPQDKSAYATDMQPTKTTDKSAYQVKLDPTKDEWGTYPVHGLFLGNGTDPQTGAVTDASLNKAVTSVVTEMSSSDVYKVITSVVLTGAVSDLGNTLSQQNVSYPDGLKTMTQLIDKVLLERLGASPTKTTFKGPTTYTPQMDVPINPQTKQPITSSNSITDINLDPKLFTLTSANIAVGAPKAPSPSASPTATPSPTPTHTP